VSLRNDFNSSTRTRGSQHAGHALGRRRALFRRAPWYVSASPERRRCPGRSAAPGRPNGTSPVHSKVVRTENGRDYGPFCPGLGQRASSASARYRRLSSHAKCGRPKFPDWLTTTNEPKVLLCVLGPPRSHNAPNCRRSSCPAQRLFFRGASGRECVGDRFIPFTFFCSGEPPAFS
jgi:hypothetical protein